MDIEVKNIRTFVNNVLKIYKSVHYCDTKKMEEHLFYEIYKVKDIFYSESIDLYLIETILFRVFCLMNVPPQGIYHIIIIASFIYFAETSDFPLTKSIYPKFGNGITYEYIYEYAIELCLANNKRFIPDASIDMCNAMAKNSGYII